MRQQLAAGLGVWCLLEAACAFAQARSELDVLRAGPRDSGFQRALQPRPFVFPADHGPHPAFRHEWWYLTGNLDAASGERFGFELTFFRVALQPPPPAGAPPASAAVSSAWRTTQLYSAHFALTDVARQHFEYTQQSSRGALGLAGAQADPFNVWLEDWRLGAAPQSVAATAPGWKLHARSADYQLDLDAQLLSDPVPNGDRGLSRKSADAASYYYSIPRVAVRGQLVRQGKVLPVSGLAWLDREWGSGALSSSQQGWDWFALQLSDGSALMFYALRNQDGSRDAYSAGTWVDAEGHAVALGERNVEIVVSEHWRSPAGVSYPAGWSVRVPVLQLTASVHPVLANQELLTTPRYWEGAVDVSAQRGGQKLGGRGYVELVGYGR